MGVWINRVGLYKPYPLAPQQILLLSGSMVQETVLVTHVLPPSFLVATLGLMFRNLKNNVKRENDTLLERQFTGRGGRGQAFL